MKQSSPKPTRQELIAMLQTKGWDFVTGSPSVPSKDVSLEEVVRTAHAKHKKGEAPGIISKVEAELELDLIEVQELWQHLGLPI